MIYKIRPAQLEDAEGIAKVHVDSWQSTYRGIISQDYLDNRTYLQFTEFWKQDLTRIKSKEHLFVVLNLDHQVIGFSCGGPNRDKSFSYDGEIYAIYLLEAYQKQGLGKRLFENSCQQLSLDGFTGLLLWVLEANPSLGFYKHMGGQVVGDKMETIGEQNLKELALAWNLLRLSPKFF